MRLIDADALMLTFNDWWYSSFGQEENERSLTIKEAMKAIENAPTVDAVEVVRCGDCKYSGTWYGKLMKCKRNGQVYEDNHYCGYGDCED